MTPRRDITVSKLPAVKLCVCASAAMFTADGTPRIDRQRLLAKADEHGDQPGDAGVERDGLRHAARCPAPSHMECPKFKRLLKLAGNGRLPYARPVRGKAAKSMQ